MFRILSSRKTSEIAHWKVYNKNGNTDSRCFDVLTKFGYVEVPNIDPRYEPIFKQVKK